MVRKKKLCQLYRYGEGFMDSQENSPEFFSGAIQLSDLKGSEVAWLNFHSIECQGELTKLFDNLDVDPLVLEDVYELDLRPKMEEYPHYVFLSARSVLPLEGAEKVLKDEQISFILGKGFLLSLQQMKGDHFSEVRSRIKTNKGIIRTKGPDFLIYRMLEAIVDNYYEVLEDIVVRSNKIEKKLIKNQDSNILKEVEFEKRRLAELRKVALPMRDLASRMEKSAHPLFDRSNSPYFSDLSDYCRGVLEEIDASKTMLEGQINLYFAVQGQRMNEIMKILTIVSAIFIPLTFLAGIYGMNFDNIPELHYVNGYYVLLSVMLVISALLFWYFRRKGWLGGKS
jgi:magnesium transporter